MCQAVNKHGKTYYVNKEKKVSVLGGSALLSNYIKDSIKYLAVCGRPTTVTKAEYSI